ncbi:hypothetical protein [uncultured Mediterranean phage uvDeep-CGR2-KM18-C74]|nr:hypothetical protein [uncultured Mediterranean phage uvDeep-CGR2-KM18-C74]
MILKECKVCQWIENAITKKGIGANEIGELAKRQQAHRTQFHSPFKG